MLCSADGTRDISGREVSHQPTESAHRLQAPVHVQGEPLQPATSSVLSVMHADQAVCFPNSLICNSHAYTLVQCKMQPAPTRAVIAIDKFDMTGSSTRTVDQDQMLSMC